MRYTIDIYDSPINLSKVVNIEQTMQSAFEYIHSFAPDTFTDSNIFIAIQFVSQQRSQQLKSMFLGIDQPTNVLSFPSGETSNIGEIAICWPIIQQQAEQQAIDQVQHLVHMLVHAVLHLIGMDHMTETERVKMENIESSIMLHLDYPDPWADEKSS